MKNINIRLKIILFLVITRLGYAGYTINEEIIINNDGNAVSNETSSLENIINSGTISGNSLSNAISGNGISNSNNNESILGDISNTGIISGNSLSDDNSGNGISNTSDQKNILGNIINSGSIVGSSTSGEKSGNAISNASNGETSLGNITNSGTITGSLINTNNGSLRFYYSGNGISNLGYGTSSSIGIVTNHGIISGTAESINYSGNGISNSSITMIDQTGSSIDSINNHGTIRGNSLSPGSEYSGNGVLNFSASNSTLGDITNHGIISGNSATSYSSGNGIFNFSEKVIINVSNNIKNITNHGIISGNSLSDPNSGNGIFNAPSNPGSIKNISNQGVIKGSNYAIKGNYDSLTNNGILAGQNITDSIYTNNGIAIILDSNKDIARIENGSEGIVNEKTIINADITSSGKDSFKLASDLTKSENLIINGAGIDKGALIVDENLELTNSIINGYNTAVYLESEKTLNATDTTFNGGGLKNDIAVIKGDHGNNAINIFGTSVINGSVDLGDGDDTLTVANTVQINGKLNGGIGDQDTLNLGQALAKATDSLNLNILHDINGFENLNTNGNITLFETINITGADNITLESGDLTLRVDPTKKDSHGNIIGHSLYTNSGILTSTGGNLVIGLNGIGAGATVSMGGTTITSDTNDSWWKDTDYIKTNSLVLDGKLSEDGKDIYITVLESIPSEPSKPIPPIDPEPPIDSEPPIDPPIVLDSLIYEKLNQVYQSIVSAGEIGALANTTLLEDKTYNESLGGLLIILDQVYSNNPYSYTLKSSRGSLKLFEDNMSYLTIKPKESETIVQGRAIYTGVRNDSIASGKNYYGFDTGHRNYKTTTSTTGGLATLEYGLSDETSVGVILGGNNQNVNFRGTSKIKGNSLYLGTFVKKDIENFKVMSGVGYQYTSADVTREVSNRYDSFSTGDKYDINSLNLFAEAKYVYMFEQGISIEPKVRLSYYHIDQEAVNEGYRPGQISMKADSAESNTADVELGVDFVKSLYTKSGKLKNILSLGVINSVGDTSKEMSGYILGKENDGKKFDIHGVEIPETSGKVAYNFELEQTNGMIYTARVSLEFAKDYNRNFNTTVGIGYKF